jgi:hypothetical protein
MPITSPCDSVSVSEGKVSKMALNRLPNALLQGGRGAGSHPTPNRVVWKWTVNVTLAMGHQADPAYW